MFTSSKKTPKHYVRFWYFFNNICLLETTFILLRQVIGRIVLISFYEVSVTVRNLIQLRFAADLKNTPLTSNQRPVSFTSVKIG